MSIKLRKKFNHIYNFERSIGNSVALRVIKGQPIGVWEFLIPVVFILHFMRNKQSREVFIQNPGNLLRDHSSATDGRDRIAV
jgi:hypothetical protein